MCVFGMNCIGLLLILLREGLDYDSEFLSFLTNLQFGFSNS